MPENVTCIPSNTIDDGLHIAGGPHFDKMLELISNSRFQSLRDKTDKSPTALENNKSIRQLVTYIMLQDDKGFYIFRRTVKTGEGRLAGKYGLPGGHMNQFTTNFIEDMLYDAGREMEEELDVQPKSDRLNFFNMEDGLQMPCKLVAVLQLGTDEDNGVHQVHTGVIVKYELADNFTVKIRDDKSLCELAHVTPENYIEYFKDSELWLRALLPWTNQLLAL